MKRHRIVGFDFDSRALLLEPVSDAASDEAKALHIANQKRIVGQLQSSFGATGFEEKKRRFVQLGLKPFSVVAFHNRFLREARNSYVSGYSYAALTAISSLGERVLNHLVLGLRDQFKGTSSYRKVYRKDSFDNWSVAIDALVDWGVLTKNAEVAFRDLEKRRNFALHFNVEVEERTEEFALEAIRAFEKVVTSQFGALSESPWIFWVPGETYICREAETNPFVKLVYLPNCMFVGPHHTIWSVVPLVAEDVHYPNTGISDDEFTQMRKAFNEGGQKRVG